MTPARPPMTWREMLYHYRYGLFSGFRRCCIRFFIRTWLRQPDGERAAHRRAMDRYDIRWPRESIQYIPCPACIKENRPPVRMIRGYPARYEAHFRDWRERLAQKIQERRAQRIQARWAAELRPRPGAR